MVVRLTVSYVGTDYAGWQRQQNAVAVQQVLEEALGDLVGHEVTLHGAGRTDAGVHALGQVAHCRLERQFPLRGLVLGSRHRLPEAVRILSAERVDDRFHARKHALGKEYLYRVHRGAFAPPPTAPFVAVESRPLAVDAIRLAMARLVGRHDFSAFALAGGGHRQAFRRLFAATVDEDGREVQFRFLGDGFLYGMVRSLVGTLLEVGRGSRAPAELGELLEGGQRSAAGPTAAARGLVLERVFYGPEWPASESYAA